MGGRMQRHFAAVKGEFSTKLSTGSASAPRFLMRIQNLAPKVTFHFNFTGVADVRPAGPAGIRRCRTDG
ncbi:hypothetical protein V4E86_07430 [Burkholderia pseudomallei]|uniref:hypothetical protein n=1 Tax=Burkholderia TaxID=32008 RepID=UPI0000F28FC7|nr:MULTISPECIES: hypothetical protein [Burkholderia]ABN81707.1 hypothetical protein BURPS668_3962 [Burkholderia pseudomallei 668]ARK88321.1 hypothetical protein BOC42_13855 [Burkholderia pseudomallei]ARL16105.1 hypothetical protein BOC46_11640 [Burkholderia pseudomallei]ARL50389.1 hypothetical protein BOC51_10710 [Burkholderia pseudomallei]AYE29191.1 hypothetical protein CNX72_19025 [Burkholderia pseudomallei]